MNGRLIEQRIDLRLRFCQTGRLGTGVTGASQLRPFLVIIPRMRVLSIGTCDTCASAAIPSQQPNADVVSDPSPKLAVLSSGKPRHRGPQVAAECCLIRL